MMASIILTPSPGVQIHKRSPLSPVQAVSPCLLQRHQNAAYNKNYRKHPDEHFKPSKKCVIVDKKAKSRAGNENNISCTPLIRQHMCGWIKQKQGFDSKPELGEEHKPFVWKKQLERDGLKHLNPKELIKLHKEKARKNHREIEEVKRRREERERVREERRATTDYELSQGEREYAKKYVEQEERFFLQQVISRTEIRLNEKRGESVDYLAYYVEQVTKIGEDTDDEDKTIAIQRIRVKEEVEHNEPWLRIARLNREELEDLDTVVDVYKSVHFEKPYCIAAWMDIKQIISHYLVKLRNGDERGRQNAMNETIKEEVHRMFEGKSLSQLLFLEGNIQSKMKQSGADVNYWETLLDYLSYYKALAKLKLLHMKYLSSRMKVIKVGVCQTQTSKSTATESNSEKANCDVGNIMYEDIMDHDTHGNEIVYQYEMDVVSADKLSTEGINLKDPQQDWSDLQMKRKHVLQQYQTLNVNCKDKVKEEHTPNGTSIHEFTQDEEEFAGEIPLAMPCSEKSEPLIKLRKPRYFNKVHTGYVWNRYNRTHYDRDNPPPKTVMGYKFNLFFSDLLNKSQVPKVTVTPCQTEPGLAVLRINGGPPYEDIGFKVVNKEWDKSWKSGYRCQLVKGGCFQLWFRFKRMCYRR